MIVHIDDPFIDAEIRLFFSLSQIIILLYNDCKLLNKTLNPTELNFTLAFLKDNKMRSALLIGNNPMLLLALPSLLSRSGFTVDLITSCRQLKYSRFIRQYTWVHSKQSKIPEIVQHVEKNYDWVILSEESVLQEILDSPLSVEKKLQLLPVLSEKHFVHLNSKVGLSQTFQTHGIKTPPFFIAHHIHEAFMNAEKLGYPILLKQNASSGGQGIRLCLSSADFKTIPRLFFNQKIVVQKYIQGDVLDLSALFLEGQLIHFNYARQEICCFNHFGPSVLRTYTPLSKVEKSFFQDLSHIGKALGIHGFTNITCIRQPNQECFYFEVDLRPNVWIDFPRYLGEDLSLRIRTWFFARQPLRYPVIQPANPPQELRLPYFLRMKPWEICLNRYLVWRYIPMEDTRLVLLFIFRIIFIKPIKLFLNQKLQKLLSIKYYKLIKKLKIF